MAVIRPRAQSLAIGHRRRIPRSTGESKTRVTPATAVADSSHKYVATVRRSFIEVYCIERVKITEKAHTLSVTLAFSQLEKSCGTLTRRWAT